MKKLMIGALMSLFALITFAQEQERIHKTSEEKASMRANEMQLSLSLSDDQSKRVELAFLTKMTKAKEIRAKYPLDKESVKKEMRPVTAQFKSTMKEILTEEQFIKWQELKNAERVSKSPEELAAMRSKQMQKSLNLSDEQALRIEAAIFTRMTKAKEIHAKYPDNKESAKKEMRPIHEQFNVSIKEILTEEQFVKWQEMKKKQPKKRERSNHQKASEKPVK